MKTGVKIKTRIISLKGIKESLKTRDAPELTEAQFNTIQSFVCDMYGHKDTNTNNVRYKMYAAKHGNLDPKMIPPCADRRI